MRGGPYGDRLRVILDGSNVSKARRRQLEELVGELFDHAIARDANAAYWCRKAGDAVRVIADRERYVKTLEAEVRRELVG